MSIKRNLIANFAGRVCTSFISFIFLPIYFRLLGPEPYGLVTVFISLTAVLQIMDFGLSTLINRELAKLTGGAAAAADESAKESPLELTIQSAAQQSESGSEAGVCSAPEAQARQNDAGEQNQQGAAFGQNAGEKAVAAGDLVRSLETVYWLIGVLVALAVVASAPWAARHWITAQKLSPATVTLALRLIGWMSLFLWPDSLYTGGLLGLQRQVTYNAIRVTVAVVQYCGAALLLTYVSRTIQAFFCWQMVMFAVQTLTLRAAVWRFLPASSRRPRFQKSVWRTHWRFAAGLTGISVLAVILGQSDRFVLARMLPLETLGYYGLAAQVAGMLTLLIAPITSAIFPNLSRIAHENDQRELAALYHKSCQFLAAIVIPAWLMLALFSSEILTFYLRNAAKASHIHLLLSLLVTGVALNCLMAMPYALQIAHSWTSLSFYKNVIAVALFIPLLLGLSARYGAPGAAVMGIPLNLSYLIIEIPIMHRRLLPGEMRRFYLQDVGLPLFLSLGVMLPLRSGLPPAWPSAWKAAVIVAACAFACLLCIYLNLRLNTRMRRVEPVRAAG